jgi:hypothetical protein
MRLHIAIATLTVAALFSSPAGAQIKLPVFQDEGKLKNVSYEETTEPSALHHGRLVRLKMTSDKEQPVTGVIVRTDSSKGIVYVRTTPRAAPRAVPIAQVKSLEKGVIRDVSYTGDVIVPEIQQIVIKNGGRTTVTYVAPTISPGELSRLAEMETMQNDLNRLEYLAALEERVLETDIEIQSEQRRNQELINVFLSRQLAPNTVFFPYYVTPNAFSISASTWLDPRMATYDRTWDTYRKDNLPQSYVRVGPTVFPGLPLDRSALNTARRSFLSVQNQGYYENGRLVAVMTEEPAKTDK